MVSHKKQTGFTLIELTVVITLIGVMLFLSVPRLGDVLFLHDSTKKMSRWIFTRVPQLKVNAVADQKFYILNVDIDTNRLWVTKEPEAEEVSQSSVPDIYQLPEDIRIRDIEFPKKGKISTGQVKIFFYKSGYSDKAMIHIENNRGNKLSYLIEPFMNHVKLYNQYAGFDD